MPTLSIDSHTRLLIAKAIISTTGEAEAIRIVPLPDGGQLLLMFNCGHIAVDLVSNQDDLFDSHRFVFDVSAQVIADMESHRDE